MKVPSLKRRTLNVMDVLTHFVQIFSKWQDAVESLSS